MLVAEIGLPNEVGDYSGKEIDFIARKGNEVKYYQVTEHLPENSTRETDNLRQIQILSEFAKNVSLRRYKKAVTLNVEMSNGFYFVNF